jgi:hypothetical protein
VKSDLIHVIDGLVRPGASPTAPMIQLGKNGQGDPLAQVSGTAVFRGDQIAVVLDPLETRGILWVRDEIDRTSMTVEYPAWG